MRRRSRTQYCFRIRMRDANSTVGTTESCEVVAPNGTVAIEAAGLHLCRLYNWNAILVSLECTGHAAILAMS